MQIPDNYLPVMPYLIVTGGYKFLEFTKEVLGAEQRFLQPRSEGVIMHGEISIGQAIIMFADATEQYAPFPGSMFLYVENVDAVLARALAFEGVTELHTVSDMSYGRSGGFRDPFGNAWWVTSPL